jgi:hypothetical protein
MITSLNLAMMSKPPAILRAFTLIANGAANNTLPASADFLTSGRGFAIGKGTKGAELASPAPAAPRTSPDKPRPISSNEAMLSDISKIMLKLFDKEIKRGLCPDDYGYGVKNATEIMIHEIQTRMHSNVAFHVAETDFENAYNTISRKLIFHVVRLHCPRLLPYLQFRYSNMVILFKDEHGSVSIISTTGVSQGCPLSSALFQLAMSHILKPIREEFRSSIISSYQDDNALTSDSLSTLDSMFARLFHAALEWGLRFNFSKMWLLSNRPFPDDFDTRYPTLSKMKRTNVGIKILGGYVGTNNFVKAQLSLALAKTRAFFARVQQLISHARVAHPKEQLTHLLFNFLRYCCPSKASYLLRVTDTRLIQPFLLPLDKEVASLLLSLINPHSPVFRTPKEYELLHDFVYSNDPNDLTSEGSVIFSRIFLPIGGLGFMSALSTAAPAFMASIAAAAPYIDRDLRRSSRTQRNGAAILDLAPIDLAFRAICPVLLRPQLDSFLPSYNKDVSRLEAQTLLSSFAKSSFQATVDYAMSQLAFSNSLANRSRYPKWLSSCHKSAALWSRAPRSYYFNKLTNEETCDALAMQIGISPFLPPVCSYCLCNIPPELSEEHAFSACGSGAQSIAGSLTEKAVGKAAKDVGINVSQPQTRCRNLPGWVPKPAYYAESPPKNRKADHLFTTDLVSFAVDVCYTGRFSDDPRHASLKLHAASLRVREKFAKYRKYYHHPEGSLVPLAMESHGALDHRLYNILYSAHNGDHEPGYDRSSLNYGLTNISVALRKSCTLHFNCVRYRTRTSPTTSSSPQPAG